MSKNKLKTPSYFIKRLRDNGFIVIRLFSVYSKEDPRQWTIMVNPSEASVLITCYINKENLNEVLFELNDGGKRITKNFFIITSPKVNIEKVKSLELDGNFTLASSSIINLIKGSSICTDSNKLYLSVKDKDVLGEITDKVRANVDSYGINISNNYEGVQFAVPIPLNFEIFRIISSMRFKDISSHLS